MINKIRINNKTRGLKQYNEVLGLLGENKYETLRFTFDEFIDGFATLIVKKHDTQGNSQNYFINLTKEDESYTLEVQNSLLDVAEEITMQLIVENENRLIFKTLPFKMEVLEAMEAEQEIPEQYSTWSELLVQKFLQVDNKLAEVTTLEEDLENKRDTGYWNGADGQNGIDGQDGYTPIKGVDYWTNQDKAEIVQSSVTQVEEDLQPTITSIENTADTANSTANTAKSIAEGANQALSYGNYQTMITAFNALANNVYNVGQNVMIITLEVPDLWISSIESTSQAYTYTTDEAFTTALSTNGYVQVGYYKLSALETQKVDLTNYVKDTDYATSNKGGVFKVQSNYGVDLNNGFLRGIEKTYTNYNSVDNTMFVSKGTLENVITGKNLETGNNKVTTILSSSTNTEYPSAKAVYDYIQSLDGDEVSY